MHLIVFSHKPCWPVAGSPTGFATDGGFPLQMEALSQLFDETTLVLPRKSSPPPGGLSHLAGRRMRVETLAEPPGTGLRRKLAWLIGGVTWLPLLWRQANRGDAIHAAVPGDIGFVGLLLALLRNRRILVRHCGTWGRPQTLADRVLLRLLIRVAGDRCVVLATGGGDAPPSSENPAIGWIFSTSLSEAEVDAAALPTADGSGSRRLISLGRLTAGKNFAASIRALSEIRKTHGDVVLDLVGRGPEEARLRALARECGVEDAVVFHGNLDHHGVLACLRGARAMVFPTKVAEGFPKAVLEALACGVPVVVPRISVLPHLLRRGGGLLVDDVEPATLVIAVRQLLDHPAEHARHAEQGRRIALEHTLEVWRDAIGRRLEAAWGEPLGTEPLAPGLGIET